MKKLMRLVLVCLMAFGVMACSSKRSSTSSGSDESASSTTEKSNTKVKKGKTLIVYYSPANSDSVDTTSSATPRVGKVSSVEYIAQRINKKVNGDLVKIVPIKAYPKSYDATAKRAESENKQKARPKFRLDKKINPEDYDVIFVGYPMWYYEMPMIMDTFFDTYNFANKTIIPFNTHAGSGDGGTYDAIRKLEPKADVKNGLPIAGDEAGDSNSEIDAWLSKLGYK